MVNDQGKFILQLTETAVVLFGASNRTARNLSEIQATVVVDLDKLSHITGGLKGESKVIH